MPSSRPILVELTSDGGMRTRAFELPEPGWFGNMSSFSSHRGAVTLTPETTHLLWTTETALMLSSFPTAD